MNKVLQDIVAERNAQDVQWGGPAHDDRHAPEEWLEYIEKQLDYANALIGMSESDPEYRERLVKIAACAIAAIQALDRYHA